MKYRLDVEHYINDRLLPAGAEIGDGTNEVFRYPVSTPERKDIMTGSVTPARTAGQPMTPSRGMTPIDDEAKKIFEKEFGTTKPDIDPTKSIPLRGTLDTAKAAPIPTRPGVKPEAPPQPSHTSAGENAKAMPGTDPRPHPEAKPTPGEVGKPHPSNLPEK